MGLCFGVSEGGEESDIRVSGRPMKLGHLLLGLPLPSSQAEGDMEGYWSRVGAEGNMSSS